MRKLYLLGASIVALAAIGLSTAMPAWASGAPENTAPPTLIFTAPKVGTMENVTKGTWTNSPTTYTYQWERCNAAGAECANIAGATNKEYLVAWADHGSTLVAAVTASNASGQATAHSAASSQVTPIVAPEFIPETHKYPVTFEATAGTSYWESKSKRSVECGTMRVTGEFTNANEIANAHLKITGCEARGVEYCPTIESKVLRGHLGYLSQPAHTVGLELGAETSDFANFKCLGAPTEARGHIIAQLSTGSGREFSLTYSESEGMQKPNAFEGGSVEQLEWNFPESFEDWGIAGQTRLVTSVKGELKA